jgi:hypothetical protein
MTDPQTGWDTSYEWKAVTLLGFGVGLTAPQMGFVMSAIGFGGFVGQFSIRDCPICSDAEPWLLSPSSALPFSSVSSSRPERIRRRCLRSSS